MTTGLYTKRPRIGAVVRGDTGGLAAQTEDFFIHMRPYKVLLIDYDVYTGYKTDYSKYENCNNLLTTDREPSEAVIRDFLKGLDVVFTVETPYNHDLYRIAHELGVKTVCQYNYEWLQHHQEPTLPLPDIFLAPSTWHLGDMTKFGNNTIYMHVPIDLKRFDFQLHSYGKKFLHIAGHRTFGDRNGTAILLEALPYIQSDVKIVIRTQDELPRPYTDSKLEIIREDVSDRRQLYNGEDVLILPRKYGGLSLQLNEALALGMPVIMPDIEPQSDFLPKEWLVEAYLKETTQIKVPIDVYECSPEALAKKIDEMSGLITADSIKAVEIAKERSWTVMRPQYEALFEALCL